MLIKCSRDTNEHSFGINVREMCALTVFFLIFFAPLNIILRHNKATAAVAAPAQNSLRKKFQRKRTK